MNEKQQQLLETALDLFYRYGVNSIGINEVISASGVAKKTLYRYYPSKEALLLACLQLRDQRFRHYLSQQMAQASSSPAALLSLFDALDLWFHNQVPALGDFRGCFFINTALESTKADAQIRQACHQHKQAIAQLIADYVSQLHSDVEQQQQLTQQLLLLKEGAITRAVVEQQLDAAQQAKDLAKLLLSAYLN